MSKVTLEEVKNYVQQMAATMSGDRGQISADLYRLLGIIDGNIPLCAPGVQVQPAPVSHNTTMTPTAATPKPKAKAKTKAKAKAEPVIKDADVDDEATTEDAQVVESEDA